MAVYIDSDGVRAVLDTSLTEDVLPNATIRLDIYAEAARHRLLLLDADAETRTGDEERLAQVAYTNLVAAEVAPALLVITQESTPDFRLSYRREGVAEIVARLRAAAEAAVALYLEADGYSIPVCFDVASGTRGW